MISILIPVYNHDVRGLAHELQQQAEKLSVPVEILCFDDGSLRQWRLLNRELNSIAGLQYREMGRNLGRSRIRNRLADASTMPYLLFLDCDSQVPDERFLERYASRLREGAVLYGGRAYLPRPPADPSLYLHWLYGRWREQQPAGERRRQPYHSFMTNNFLVPKNVFQDIRFDERLLQYGHEDTLFGLELRDRGVPICHLANPLFHIGLEPLDAFLEKTQKGIQNLVFLHQSGSRVETRLLQTYKKLERRRLSPFFHRLLAGLRPLMLRQLKSARPSLFVFDLYKLSLLLEEMAKVPSGDRPVEGL